MEIFDYPEGATPLDPDELEGLKFSHITTRGELDEVEAANISNGLIWLGRQKSVDVLTDEFVRTLHKKLFGDVWAWAGKYRKTEKNIGIDPLHIGVQLRHLLDNARYWVENHTYSPKESAARLHHGLVLLHPFPNGNGRHARVMADALLEKHFGLEPFDWGGDIALQNDGDIRRDYINALRAADGHDFGPLLEFLDCNE